MAFGDSSLTFQRGASLGTGLRLETGEWTGGSTTSICVPTNFTRVISFVGDGTQALTGTPDVSNGFIVGTTNETTSSKVINYVAFGW